MGNLEKLVLLVLLFGAAVVLALTLNKSKAAEPGSGPLDAAQAKLGERARPAPSAEEQAPGLLLHAGDAGERTSDRPSAGLQAPLVPAETSLETVATPPAVTAPAPEANEPAAASDGRILKSTLGLEPSILDEYMVHTVAAGDTWAGLAQRFYQDGRYTRNLHLANEDQVELTPGAEILVPIYDFLQDAGLQPALETAEVDEKAPASGTIVPASSLRASSPSVTGRSQEYVVRSGDSLSEIALAAYGSAARWPEILEANRDKLQTPEELQVGMKLQIPGEIAPTALAALRTVAPEKSTKTATKKPATKPEPAPAPSKPKKKVQ